MAFGSYSDLRTEVLAQLNRATDAEATTRFDGWLALFEAKARRVVRASVGEIRAINSNVTLEWTPLPDDFIASRAVRLEGATRRSLEYLPPQTADEKYSTVGAAEFYTIEGNALRIIPPPGAAEVLTMTYWSLPSLTATNTTNWLLLNAPDAYFYGVLAESAHFYRDAEAEQINIARRDKAIDDLNKTAVNRMGGPLIMRTGTHTP